MFNKRQVVLNLEVNIEKEVYIIGKKKQWRITQYENKRNDHTEKKVTN